MSTEQKQRACPNMRTCWSFSWEAYSLKATGTQLARAICMWLILGIRTAMSVIGIVYDATRGHIGAVIVYSILGVLGFFFIAWCLAVISQAEGSRKVLGMNVGRVHFDVFLALMALIHLGILIGFFFGQWIVGFGVLWLILWLTIFGVAWVARWPAESNSYV